MDTTVDQTMAEISALISASGSRANRIARLLLSTAKAALKPKEKAVANQQQVGNAAPGVHRVKGAVGLHLRKGENGSGSWFYRFRLGGRRPEMGLGAIADVTLAEARAKADALRPQIRSGVNPIDARRTAKTETMRAAALAALAAGKRTFAQATENYVAAHASSWKHRRSRALWLNPVVKYAYPVIGDMPLNDIKLEHIVAIMGAVAQGAPAAGPRVRLKIEQVFSAAIALGQRDASLGNPAAGKLVKAVRPAVKRASDHFRRLPLDNAPAACRQLKERAQDSTAFAAWVLTIACATRPGEETLKAQWDEFDLKKKLWTIPAARMKGIKGAGKEHVVPLSSLALWALERQAERRTGEAVFPGLSARRSPTPPSPERRGRRASTPGAHIAGARSSATPAAIGCASTATSPSRRWLTASARSRPPTAAKRRSRPGGR
jgi:hypothetical protein